LHKDIKLKNNLFALFIFFVLPNTQAFAATKKTKNHQKSLFFKNQALYGQTLFIKNPKIGIFLKFDKISLIILFLYYIKAKSHYFSVKTN
jgi:uncharacterized membrane protein